MLNQRAKERSARDNVALAGRKTGIPPCRGVMTILGLSLAPNLSPLPEGAIG
jgi:hypothetical protein